MHFTDCRLYTMFSFCEQKYWYTGQGKKDTKMKMGHSVEGSCNNPPKKWRKRNSEDGEDGAAEGRVDRMSWSGSQVWTQETGQRGL